MRIVKLVLKVLVCVLLLSISVLSFFPCVECYGALPGVLVPISYYPTGNTISNAEWVVFPLTLIAVFCLFIDKRGTLLISMISSALILLITLIVPFYLSVWSMFGDMYKYTTLGYTVLSLSILSVLLIAVNIVIQKLIRNESKR